MDAHGIEFVYTHCVLHTIPRLLTASVALIALGSTSSAAQAQPTLRELARVHGGIGSMLQCCGPAPALSDIVRRADLIVEGIVESRASYLTTDERDVYTDYELAIRRVLFQRQVLAASTPGVVIPMVFKSHGGQVLIDGLRVTVDVMSNSARVTLKEGDHVYLFARRDTHDGKWLVDPFDVFTITDGNVVTPDEFRDLAKSVPQQNFLRRIHELQPAAGYPF